MIGTEQVARPQVIKKLWLYIKDQNLQGPANKRSVNADAKLLPVFGKQPGHLEHALLAVLTASSKKLKFFSAALKQHCTKEYSMPAITSSATVKIIGANGQISLGKQFAGRQVLVEEQEAGVWLIRTATVIPDNERWLHQPQAAADLSRALEWSMQHPATGAETDAILLAAAAPEKS